MATKVNTKFVVGLLAVMLIAVGGVGFLAMRAFAGSGDRLAAQGDAAMLRYEQALAAGNAEDAKQAIREAASAYERAVGKETTRLDWLEKWQKALLLVTPTSPTHADQLYRWFVLIPRNMAMLQPDDPAASLEYFDVLWTELEGIESIPGLERLVTEVDALARRYPESNPDTHRVRAYKAKAIVRMMGITQVEEQRRDEAKAVLEAAVQALPDDPDPVLWLARWHVANGIMLREARRADRAAESHAVAVQIANDGVARFPGAVELKLLRLDLARQDPAISGNAEATRATLGPMVQDIVATLERQPVEALEPRLIMATGHYAQALGRTDDLAACITLLERLADANPDKPRPWLALAQMFERQRDYPRMIEAAGRVLTVPDPTVGLDSRNMPALRRYAAQFQVDAALALWELASEPAEREQLEKQAMSYFEQFVPRVSSTQSYLLSDRRGRIAMLRGNAGEAVAQLAEAMRGYEAAGVAAPLPALRSLAAALEQTNNLGEAMQAWRRVLEHSTKSGGDDPMARLRIGRLATELHDYQTAIVELQAAADQLSGNAKAPALYGLAMAYERLIDRNESVTLPGRGVFNEQQLIAEASKAYQELNAISPGNEQVLAGIARLQARAGQGGDPELIAAMAATRLAERGEHESALDTVQSAINAGHNSPRLWLMKIDLLVRLGQSEQAMAAAQQAASLYPENQTIQRFLRLSQADDPAEAALQDIEDPFQRAIARYQIAASRNDEAGMSSALEEARRLDAEHALVLEIDFERALNRRDWDRAGSLARRAGERNLDQVGGRMYQGRLQYAKGDYADAVRTMRQTVEQLEFNPTAWRLLGLSQLQLGRTNEAVDALARAMQGRPSDFDIARDYANALVRAGRGADALAVVDNKTGVLRFGRGSPQMVELWLDLATRYGGEEGKKTALEERRTMHERDPSNLLNAVRLAETLFEIQAWDEAGAVIDHIASNPSATPIRVAGLRARLLHQQGKTAEAVGVFESFLADPAHRDSPEALIAFSDLLFAFGMKERGLEQLRLADEKSGPGQLEAARKLGNVYFQAGVQSLQAARQLEAQGVNEQTERVREIGTKAITDAIALFKRVLDSTDRAESLDPAEATALGLLVVEGQLQIGQLDEAQHTLNGITSLPSDDLRRLIAMARLATLRGDKRQASQIMDDAVRTNPNNAAAFLNRARINAENTQMIQDVLADLERATELQPSNLEAWQLRVALLRERGEMNSAVASLRSAIQMNPNQDNLKTYLVDTLLGAGRLNEAAAEAIAQADAQPQNKELQLRTLVLLQQIERWQDSARLLARLREAEPDNPFYAASWLDSRVNAGARLTAAEVMPLLRIVRGSSAYNTPNEPVTWPITEAKVLHALMQAAQQSRNDGQAQTFSDQAQQAIARGLRLILANPAGTQAWFQAATTVLGSSEAAIQLIHSTLGDQPLPPALIVLEQNQKLIAGDGNEAALREVLASTSQLLSEHKDNPALHLELLKTQGLAQTQLNMHREAVESFKAIIQLNPNDAVSLNNLAYLLATELKQPAEALEYAERAQTVAPDNATLLDTLGTVLLAFDPPRYADAERALRRAVSLGRSPDELLPANLHLAQALLGQGSQTQARTAAAAARRALESASPTTAGVYRAQVEALEKQLP